MEDKRKQFNIADFVSNEKTPVETRIGYKVTIYSTDRKSAYKVCGDIHTKKESVVSTWMPNGKYQSSKPIDEFELEDDDLEDETDDFICIGLKG